MSANPGRFLDERQALACIHCGLCLSSCPTYLETGDENLSPRGRIHLMRALESGRLELDERAVRPLDLCLGCRACEAACPSGVEYGALLEATRDHIEHHHPRPAGQRLLRRGLVEQIFPYPARMELALRPATFLKRLGLDRFLPSSLRSLLTLVPAVVTADDLPERSPATVQPARGQVAFLRGCVMSAMFGATNAASVRLLNRAGYDVIAPPGQGCCGALYSHGGNLEQARAAARRNIAAFELPGVGAIVTNAAGCGSSLKEYHHLFGADPAWRSRADAFRRRVKDLTEVLAGTPEFCQALGPRPAAGRPRVTFHDACHLAHAQRITSAPRELVRCVAGEDWVELPESDVCCGSAGSYNLTEPAMAARLQGRKVANILKTGANIVVSTNPGCLLQIRVGLDQAGAAGIRTLHVADYLDQHSGPLNSTG